MTRTFECHYTGEVCTEPRCKKDHCALQIEDRQRAADISSAEWDLIRKDCETAAKIFLSSRGEKQPSPERIAAASRLPNVVTAAKLLIAANKRIPEADF